MVKAMQIKRFGGPEVFQMVSCPDAPLAEDSVRIEVKACGVNFADLMMRMGLYPEAPRLPFVPGYEIAGIVSEVGSEVQGLELGTSVLAGTYFGGYTSSVVLPSVQVARVPEGLSFVQAASIPVNFLTAWVALHEMGRVRKEDRVLIPSAAGGVGIAAVQIAAQAGACVTGLVGSEAKKEAVKALGAHEVFTYEEHEKNSKTYELILNASGGRSLKQDFKKLVPAGRLVGYGASQLVQGSRRSWWKAGCMLLQSPLFSPLWMENRGVFGLNLLKYLEDPSARLLLQVFLHTILERFQEGSFQTLVGKTFPLQEAADAHRYLQSRENIGKIVLISET